MCFGR
ncbi:hypothetical protein LINPERHAP1_LOCUS23092 [Linum perenne]